MNRLYWSGIAAGLVYFSFEVAGLNHSNAYQLSTLKLISVTKDDWQLTAGEMAEIPTLVRLHHCSDEQSRYFRRALDFLHVNNDRKGTKVLSADVNCKSSNGIFHNVRVSITVEFGICEKGKPPPCQWKSIEFIDDPLMVSDRVIRDFLSGELVNNEEGDRLISLPGDRSNPHIETRL